MNGISFFMNGLSLLQPNYDLYFEPENPITTPLEFTSEILCFSKKENQFVTILEESMEPIIKIEGTKYICRLGEPLKQWNPFKSPIRSNSARFLGYQWVYLYKI